QATDEQIQVLLQNACDLVGLVHKNIACLVGTSYTGSEKQSSSPNLSRSKPLLIYPYAEYGNLKQYLRSTSFGCPDQHSGLGFTARNLITVGLQIIKALEFLHGRRIVHKDVAARNCMLGRNFRVLLSDAALSRDLFPEDYQCLGDNTNRPIKWLALEALVERKYTSSTDIWAAGVTLWELVTKCQQPYDSLDAFEMLHILRAGYRMCQPPNCPDDL
ncbi:protein tyrosine kinase, partial [Opisthorchis viverrini]